MSSRILDREAALAFKPWRPAAFNAPGHPTHGAGAPNGHARGTDGAHGVNGAGATGAAQAREAALAAERERARAEGYAAGYAEGRAAGAAHVASEAERLAAIAARLEAHWGDAEQALSSQVLELALHVARKVLHGDVRARREALLPVVQEALYGLVDASQRAEIQVHPADAALVRAGLGEELSRGHWKLVEDQRIEPGGCRIVAPQGEIDGTLAMRWRRVLDVLGRDLSWTDADE